MSFNLPYNATDVIVPLTPIDSDGAAITGLAFNSADLTIEYMKAGQTSFTEITLVTATVGTYTSSGFVEIDGGIYELGLPSAAVNPGSYTLLRFTYDTNPAQPSTILFTQPSQTNGSVAVLPGSPGAF
jgi:hypothetical protein